MIAVNLMAYSKPKVEKKIPTRENYTFIPKDDWTLPEGAIVKREEKYVSIREIENGYILEERTEYRYCEKEEENKEMGESNDEEMSYDEDEKWGSEVKVTFSRTKPKVEIS